MSRPAVGITVSLGTVTAGMWTLAAAYSPIAYVRAVQRADARPVLLVPDARDAEEPESVLATLDGLIVTGGAGDLDPSHYGQEAHPATAVDDPVRDACELALVRTAAATDVPVLGVCRGMEVINVACGGALEQHLPDALGHDRHRRLPAGYAEHEVRLEPGSLAARAAGRERERVLSHHHQGVRTVAPSLRATGWATLDDTVEAVEAPDHPFLLGVLWHPEEDEQSVIIGTLVDAARRAGGSVRACRRHGSSSSPASASAPPRRSSRSSCAATCSARTSPRAQRSPSPSPSSPAGC